MLRCICGPDCVSLLLLISSTHDSISRVWCLPMNNAFICYLGVQMWLCFCIPTLSHNYLHMGTNIASFLATWQCLHDLHGSLGMAVNSIRSTCCSSVVNHWQALSLQYCQEKKEKPCLEVALAVLGGGEKAWWGRVFAVEAWGLKFKSPALYRESWE